MRELWGAPAGFRALAGGARATPSALYGEPSGALSSRKRVRLSRVPPAQAKPNGVDSDARGSCCWPRGEVPPWMNQPVLGRLTIAQTLWAFNIAGAALHLVMAIVVLIASAQLDNWSTDMGVLLPVYPTRLLFTIGGRVVKTRAEAREAAIEVQAGTLDAGSTSWDLLPRYVTDDPSVRTDLNLTWMVFGFFALSSFFHLVIAVASPFLSIYYWWIDQCRNPWRWIEYAFSSSLMIAIIAFFAGVRNSHLLLCLTALNFTVMTYGWVTEALSRPDVRSREPDPSGFGRCTRWRISPSNPETMVLQPCGGYLAAALQRLGPHLLAWVPYVLVWYVVLDTFLFSMNQADADRRAPDWVIWAIVGQMMLFSCFALVQLLQQGSDWGCRNYWALELTYICLSLTAKVLLGSVLLANVLLISGDITQALVEDPDNL